LKNAYRAVAAMLIANMGVPASFAQTANTKPVDIPKLT